MAKLQVIFDGKVLKEYSINKEVFTIGRNANNDVVIENKSISNQHAVIRRLENDYQIEDLGSTNGTKLNGNVITKTLLSNGDHIGLFKHVIHYIDDAHDYSKGEEEQQSTNDYADDDATIMLNADQVQNMVSDYKQAEKKDAEVHLEIEDDKGQRDLPLKDRPVIIGRNRHCHIQTGGWFWTSAISAVIKKDLSGTYSIKPETTIKINGKKTSQMQLLKANDQIIIRNTSIIFRI